MLWQNQGTVKGFVGLFKNYMHPAHTRYMGHTRYSMCLNFWI